jgi:hypothetical protein
VRDLLFSGWILLTAVQVFGLDRSGRPPEDFWSDQTSPVLMSLHPEADATDVTPSTPVSLTLLDHTGVDSASVRLQLNDRDRTSLTFFEPTHRDSLSGYVLTCQPAQPWEYGEHITVHIRARDRSYAQNRIDSTYTFTCLVDTTAPQLVSCAPEAYVYANSTIRLRFSDDLSGLDESSLSLKVNGSYVYSHTARYRQGLLTVTYADHADFKENTILRLDYSLADKQGNRLDGMKKFWVDQDVYAPTLSIHPQSAPVTRAHPGDTLWVSLRDRGMGLETESISMYLRGSDITSRCKIVKEEQNSNPDSVTVELMTKLGDHLPGVALPFRILARDRAHPPNSLDTTFSVLYEKEAEDVVVVPPLITPNNDGYNDRAHIYIHPEFDVKAVRLYDLRNRHIADCNVLRSNQNQYAIWNGTDNTGAAQAGGIYIYQVQTSSRSYQGTIVVAR